MKYVSMVTAAALLAFSSTPAFSQANECSVGTWAPDYDMLLARIAAQINAPNASVSGTVSMVIKMAHNQEDAEEEMQFHADNWSLVRGDGDSMFGEESVFVLNGIASYTFSADASGSFHIAQQSSTFAGSEIMLNTEEPSKVFEPMLPVGEWAGGTWSCVGDVIQFEVGEQDSDGHLVETWYRQ